MLSMKTNGEIELTRYQASSELDMPKAVILARVSTIKQEKERNGKQREDFTDSTES